MAADDGRRRAAPLIGEPDRPVFGDPDQAVPRQPLERDAHRRRTDAEPLGEVPRPRHLALVLDVVDRLEVPLGGFRTVEGWVAAGAHADGIYAHSASEGSTSKPGASGPWTRSRCQPAAAIIAALSVQRSKGGITTRSPLNRAPTASRSARLAATPPTTATVVAPVRSAAISRPATSWSTAAN